MRWLLWCFCLLAESYETINHYHYHYHFEALETHQQCGEYYVWPIPFLSLLLGVLSPLKAPIEIKVCKCNWVMVLSRPVTSVGKDPLQTFSLPLENCDGNSLKLLDVAHKIWAPLRKLFAPPGVLYWLRAWFYPEPPVLHLRCRSHRTFVAPHLFKKNALLAIFFWRTAIPHQTQRLLKRGCFIKTLDTFSI